MRSNRYQCSWLNASWYLNFAFPSQQFNVCDVCVCGLYYPNGPKSGCTIMNEDICGDWCKSSILGRWKKMVVSAREFWRGARLADKWVNLILDKHVACSKSDVIQLRKWKEEAHDQTAIICEDWRKTGLPALVPNHLLKSVWQLETKDWHLCSYGLSPISCQVLCDVVGCNDNWMACGLASYLRGLPLVLTFKIRKIQCIFIKGFAEFRTGDVCVGDCEPHRELEHGWLSLIWRVIVLKPLLCLFCLTSPLNPEN